MKLSQLFPGLTRKPPEPYAPSSGDVRPWPPPDRLSRYLLLRGWTGSDPSVVVVWIDSPNSCSQSWSGHPFHRHGKNNDSPAPWHSYQTLKGATIVVRCPASLSPDEQSRAHSDEPPGSWRSDALHARREMIRLGREKWERQTRGATPDENEGERGW